jgi:ribosome biogenesis protein BRX1
MFGVPRLARRAKPFIDHVISFSILDNKIWFRNYQIMEKDPGKGSLAEVDEAEGKKRKSKSAKTELESPTLVEIGPRMVMTPIRIFEGSFGGATVYENPEYISPNATRHDARRTKGEHYKERTTAIQNRKAKVQKLADEAKPDELSREKVFA